jgi:hypothetical protein
MRFFRRAGSGQSAVPIFFCLFGGFVFIRVVSSLDKRIPNYNVTIRRYDSSVAKDDYHGGARVSRQAKELSWHALPLCCAEDGLRAGKIP